MRSIPPLVVQWGGVLILIIVHTQLSRRNISQCQNSSKQPLFSAADMVVLNIMQHLLLLPHTSILYSHHSEWKVALLVLWYSTMVCILQLSSIIVNVYKSLGFGAKITDPITGDQSHTIGCLFVDDADLSTAWTTLLSWHAPKCPQLRLTKYPGGHVYWMPQVAQSRAQTVWYLLAYVCLEGIWSYADMEEVVEVPLPNGESVSLTSKPAHRVEKTLGVLTAPCGGHAAQLACICVKADKFSYNILNGHLPASHVWRSYCYQLRAQLLYALGTLTNDLKSA